MLEEFCECEALSFDETDIRFTIRWIKERAAKIAGRAQGSNSPPPQSGAASSPPQALRSTGLTTYRLVTNKRTDEWEQFERCAVEWSNAEARKSEDPLEFWTLYSTALPSLAQVARDVYAMPAASTNVERLFSSAGIVTASKFRGNLAAESVFSQTTVRSVALAQAKTEERQHSKVDAEKKRKRD